MNGLGYEIISTGGTFSAIEKMGVPVKKVEDVTGFPEMLDGEAACTVLQAVCVKENRHHVLS